MAEGRLPGWGGGLLCGLLEMCLPDLLAIQKVKSRRETRNIFASLPHKTRVLSNSVAECRPRKQPALWRNWDTLLSRADGHCPPMARPAEFRAVWTTSVAEQTRHVTAQSGAVSPSQPAGALGRCGRFHCLVGARSFRCSFVLAGVGW